jgi:hypothetical protein
MIKQNFNNMKNKNHINKENKNDILKFQNPNKYILINKKSDFVIELEIEEKRQKAFNRVGKPQNPRKKKFDYFKYRVYHKDDYQEGIKTTNNIIERGKIHSKKELNRLEEYL